MSCDAGAGLLTNGNAHVYIAGVTIKSEERPMGNDLDRRVFLGKGTAAVALVALPSRAPAKIMPKTLP